MVHSHLTSRAPITARVALGHGGDDGFRAHRQPVRCVVRFR